jgi:mannose-P-dolichol utilization defect protein 1
MAGLVALLNETRPLLSPWLVSDACFDSLVLRWNVLDVACIKLALSKAAGYGIVVFSSVLKVPLILNIARSRSVAGLSTAAVYVETTMYLAVLAYHLAIGSPFSTYGEKYGLVAQNLLITALLWRYGSKSLAFCLLSLAGLAGVLAVIAAAAGDPAHRHALILYSSAGAVVSRVPQIYINWSNGHTGVLSLGTLFAAVLGGAVRLLTVLNEVDDLFAVGGEVVPLLLNVVILAQIVVYGSATKAHMDKLSKAKRE